MIVNATSLNVKATFLQSLDSALKQAGLSKIMPTTFFDAAIEKIHSWKERFPTTYKAFEKIYKLPLDIKVEFILLILGDITSI